MILIKAGIVGNKNIVHDYWVMTVETPEIARAIKPGQFLHIRCGSGTDPLLRRPLSPYKIDGERIQILYEVVGKGTKVLSEMRAGETLDILGPLGNTFILPSLTDRKSSLASLGTMSTVEKTTVLIGGGIGIPPLMMLAQALKGKDVTAIIGAQTEDLLIGEKDFKALGVKVEVCTDDGSRGLCGYPTDKLHEVLSGGATFAKGDTPLSVAKESRSVPFGPVVYACGPKPMLVSIAKVVSEFNVPCQVSMEERMGCGVGVCLGCVIKTIKGLRRVCKDGPVFDIMEIVWT